MSEDLLPLGVDRSSSKFRQYEADGRHAHLIDARGEELAKRAVERIGYPLEGLQAEAAADFLAKFIDAVTADMLKSHGMYGRVRWLWYLRRVPEQLFAGDYRTTLGYDSALADSLSWFFEDGGVSTSSKYIAFPDDEGAFRHVCRFIGGVKLLSHLHAMYRRSGKGAVLRFEGNVPFANHSARIATAIRTYDERHDRSNEVTHGGLGLFNVEADGEKLSDNTADKLFLVVRCAPLLVPVNAPDGEGGFTKQRVLARFALTSTSLGAILSPLPSATSPSAPYLQKIEAYLLLLVMFPVLAARVPWALSSAVQFGYFFVKEHVIQALFDDWLDELATHLQKICPELIISATYTAWVEALVEAQPMLWPLRPGGAIRKFDSHTLMVDVASASNAVLQHLEFDRTASELANRRSKAFELQVQAMIASSNWKPPVAMLELRGIHLRRSGMRIGEVDAVAAKSDTLLLVSCKSVIYDRDYDKGEYRVVRNVETTINGAVHDWLKFVAAIEEQRVGDNFDFSAYTRIIGVVCTPFAVYTCDAEALGDAAEGLRRCVSVLELRDWLGSDLTA